MTPVHEKDKCLYCHRDSIHFYNNVYDTRFGINKNYDLVYCSLCDIIYVLPQPSLLELKNLYENLYNFGGEKETKYTRMREILLSSRLYKLWLALDGDVSFHSRRGHGLLLDVGSNEGRGLHQYSRNGFEAEGLEMNAAAALVARSRGFKVHGKLIEELDAQDRYDIVVLSNVLEHALDPVQMLQNVYRILKSDGQVWISCPNNRSWLRSVFGKYWINWHVPFHIVHFSRKSLSKILENNGFNKIEIRQETPALWAAHSVIARLFARKGKPTKQLRNPLLVVSLMLFWRGFLFPFLWLGNRLGRGDCLVVTARKR